MEKYELSERLASMWVQSRTEAGASQEHMARALGVSRKTIQNWENGTAAPNFRTAIEWFNALGVPFYPYIMSILHCEHSLSSASSGEDVKDALMTYISEMSEDTCRKLLFLLYGNHGSNPSGIIELMTAYLHTPLSMRLNIANSVITNYRICEAHGILDNQEHIQPNMEWLTDCALAGTEAVMKSKNSYI